MIAVDNGLIRTQGGNLVYSGMQPIADHVIFANAHDFFVWNEMGR